MRRVRARRPCAVAHRLHVARHGLHVAVLTRASMIVSRTTLLASLAISSCVSTPPPPPHDHAHDEHAPLVHRFDDPARWAKEFDDPGRDTWQKPADVVAAMKIAPGMVIADIGAGTGYFEPYLARAVGASGKVFAIDLEPSMVRYLTDRAAREHLDNVTVKLAAPGSPGLEPSSADRILIVDTWHHIPDRTAYATKLLAALRAGGTVTIVDFTLESSHGPPRAHRIAPAQVVAELATGGMKAEIVQVGLPEQYAVVGQRP